MKNFSPWQTTIISSFIVGLAVALITLPDFLSAEPPIRLPVEEDSVLEPNLPGLPDAIPHGDPGTYCMGKFQQMALDNNPSLGEAYQRIEELRGEMVQVGLRPNPSMGWVADEMGNEGAAGRQGIGFSQEIITANKLQHNRAVVCEEIAAAEWAYETQRMRVLNDIGVAYYEVLTSQYTIEMRRELVRISREGSRITQSMFDAREVGKSDVLQAKIETTRSEMALQNAINNQKSAWRRLVAMAGQPDLPPAEVSGKLEGIIIRLSWEQTRESLLANSPEIAQALTMVDRAQSELSRQCAYRRSNYEIEGNVLYNNASLSTEASLGISTPIRIFDRNQGAIQRANAAVIRSQLAVDRVELSLLSRLAEVFESYENAMKNVGIYQSTLLEDSEDSLRLAQEGYKQGELPYANLLAAQRTFYNMHLEYITSLRRLKLATVQLDGYLLSGGLDAVEQ